MDIWIQILIGIVPALIAGLVLTAVSKNNRTPWIVSVLLIMLAGGLAVAVAKSSLFDPGKDDVEEAAEFSDPAEADDYILLSYAFMRQDDHDAAQKILEEYLDNFPYSEDYVLAMARLNVLKGDLHAANGLYGLVGLALEGTKISSAESVEIEAVDASLDSSLSYNSWQNAVKEVNIIIRDLTDMMDDSVLDVASVCKDVVNASEEWNSYTEEEKRTKANWLAGSLEALERSEDASRYFSIGAVQDSAMRVQIVNEDYSAAIEKANAEPDSDSLLAVAELMRNELITPKDLNDITETEDSSDSELLQEWLEKQLESNSYTQDEKNIINEILAEITEDDDKSSAGVSWIKNKILQYISRGQNDETSKLYLELARLSYESGQSERAAEYLDLALGTARDSEDPVYIGAAESLLDIIQDPDDTEARKQIADYTSVLVDNLLSGGIGNITSASSVPAEDDFLGEGELSADESVPVTGEVSFTQYCTDTMNQSAGDVNIISVDASRFDQVEAIVAVDESIAGTAEDFKKNVKVLDCSVQIDDYEVEKIEYKEVNLVLVCDNSGSMGGEKIQNLKNALNTFVEFSDDVSIVIVPFDSNVRSDSVATSGDGIDKLKECIDNMQADGGTNIYSSVNFALEGFSNKDDALNVLILMSDGQDGTPSGDAISAMTAACQEKNVSIYSMGLGSDVDSGVLSVYSDLGGGSYMYVSDSNSLLSFYQYFYQLCKNRYRVTYTAADTVKTNRLLEIEGTAVTAYDDYPYYLYDSDISEDDLGEEYQVSVGDVTLNGLENRLFYQCSIAQETNLSGSGFQKDDTVSVEIRGGVKYALDCDFVDENHIKVTVPANVACGVYDVYVTYNGARTVFQSGFVMTSKDRNVVRFGDYVFTGTDLSVQGDTTTLSGVVDMNEWLGITNSVSLTGDLENDYTIEMSCEGSYLQYTNNGTCTGLAKYLAEHGYTVSLPGFSDLKLYNDATVSSSSDDYPVDTMYLNSSYFRIVDFIGINGAGISLYPDRAVINFEAFDTKFPFQETMMKAIGADDLFSFTMDHSESVTFKQDQIGCSFSFELGQDDDDYSSLSGKLGNMNMYYKKGSLKVDVDTIEGDITFKIKVDIAFLSDGLGLQVQWKDWKFDGATVYADKKFSTYVGNIPVTFSDFSLGVSELSKNDSYSLANILSSKWTGTFDCSMADISAVYPGLDKYLIKTNLLKDAAIAKLDDTTIEFSLKQRYLSVSTTLKVFGIAELGSCKLELGSGISYTNLLLGMDGESVSGIVGSLTKGLKIDTNNCDINASIAGKVALTDKIFGVTGNGELSVDLSWWVLVKKYQAKGEIFLGTYRQHNGEWQFAVYAAGSSGSGSNMTPICWPSGALATTSL